MLRRLDQGGPQMKKLFFRSLALIAVGLGTPSAFAAERPVPAYTPPPPPAPAYTWSGCYVGASAGWGSGTSDGFVTSAGTLALGVGPGTGAVVAGGFPITNSFNLTGFIGGANSAVTGSGAHGCSASRATAPRPINRANRSGMVRP